MVGKLVSLCLLLHKLDLQQQYSRPASREGISLDGDTHDFVLLELMQRESMMVLWQSVTQNVGLGKSFIELLSEQNS